MLIKTLTVGPIETNCYIVTDEDTRKCAVIDPGDESNTILDYLESNKLTAEVIFLTHGHFDHYMALPAVVEATGAPVFISKKDVNEEGEKNPHKIEYTGDAISNYAEGDVMTVSGLNFVVIETPGHSPGSVTLMCENALFTGDTLFRDSCGRTDLGGSMETLLVSLKRLADFEGDYEVYPGHSEATTLERERRFNYYVRYANGDIKPE